MRETLWGQAGQIKYEMRSEVKDALVQPLQDTPGGAGHARQNVRETKWLTLGLVLALGIVLGLLLVYLPLRSGLVRLEVQVGDIAAYLAAQQTAPVAWDENAY